MAIAFSNLGATTGGAGPPATNPDIATSSDATSYSTSSWTPPTADLILAFAWTGRAGTNPPVATMTGNSLTWTSITSVIQGSVYRAQLFGANASGSSTGTTTIDFGGLTMAECSVSFSAATGVDLTGGVAAAFVQSPSAAGFSTTASVSLSTAGDSANRPFAGVGASQPTTVYTPRASWSELDNMNSNFARILTEYRTDTFETTASATWTTSASWGIIAAELKATAAGGATALDPMGMQGFFGG